MSDRAGEGTTTPSTAPAGPAPQRKRARISVVGVLGELLITAGVLVLLFLGWQLWLNDLIVAPQLEAQARAQSQKWDDDYQNTKPAPSASASASPTAVPVAIAPANAKRFASLIVPRFGSDFYRPIAQGVGVKDVLNQKEVGHYPTTQMPGELGNFVIASHRSAYGGALHRLHEMHVGDHVYIETEAGWYEYTFRNLEYVKPNGVGVLDPVPQQDSVEAKESILTLTTCNPFFSTAERIIGYALFDRFYSRADGPPSEISATVTAQG